MFDRLLCSMSYLLLGLLVWKKHAPQQGFSQQRQVFAHEIAKTSSVMNSCLSLPVIPWEYGFQLVPIWFAFMVSAFLHEIRTTTIINHVLGGITMRKIFSVVVAWDFILIYPSQVQQHQLHTDVHGFPPVVPERRILAYGWKCFIQMCV